MPILLQGDCNFTPEENGFLDYVASPTFPWYAGMGTKNFPCLTHNVLLRTDKKTSGLVWSPVYEDTVKIFNRICADNGITVRTIYRMAFNLTFSDPSKHGDPHIDHPDFQHKIMLIYLTKFDAGETYLFDENENFVETVPAKKDTFAVVHGGMHAQGFCKPQQFRMVLVATFDGDIEPTAEKAE